MELDFDVSVKNWNSCDPVELFTAPVSKRIRGDETQKQIEKTLMKEAKYSQWLILWLDCDREGENIAYEVKSICERSNAKMRVFRARFSALIPLDISHAVQNLSEPNEKLSLAVDARSEIDLRIGAAFTRFQTMRIHSRFPALKQESGVISYGPCQFPTLGFVVERFLKIQNFKRETFYNISVTHQDQSQSDAPVITFKWKREHLFDRMACLCLYECVTESQTATIESVDKRPSWKKKPLPLTTVELQKRASRWLRISSEATMKAVESLYNKGFISYPRTETSKFKEGTDLLSLVRLHENHREWGNYVARQLLQENRFEAPRHGNSDDQAHPPIHPTKCVDLNTLSDPNEKKLYEFVALHFLACCSRDAKGSETNITMRISNETFTASGLMVEERNFLDIYKYEKWKGSVIPVYQRGDVFRPSTLVMLLGETNPPPLLSEADLIAKMDSSGIGTDATIAEHIKTILKRKYAIKVNNNTQFKPTTLGLALVLSYEHMGLELAKPILRAAMEKDCKAISLGEKAIRQVVDSCMDQMKSIFVEVARSASVLDQTFSDQFGQPVVDIPKSPFIASIEAGSHTSGRWPNKSTDSVVKCSSHNEPCAVRTVRKDGPNKGRKFYSCQRSQTDNSCGYFLWQDEAKEILGAADLSAPKCTGHDTRCVLRDTRKPGPNQNREFYTCSVQGSDSCGYFEWKDEMKPLLSRPAPVSIQPSAGGGDNKKPTCGCGLPSVLLTCKKGSNKGRTFCKCPNPQASQCDFFQWMT